MATFARTIERLDARDCGDLTAVAHTAHWRVTCVEHPSVARYGTAALGPADPQDFTSLGDVTEAQVRGWLGDAFWDSVEAALAAEVAAVEASTETARAFGSRP